MGNARVRQIAGTLGEVDQNLLMLLDGTPYDYPPNSVALPIRVATLEQFGLALVVAESYVSGEVALMVCRKADIATAIVILNVLVRELGVNTSRNSTFELPESVSDLSLAHTDPDFYCDRYMCAAAKDFGISLPESVRAYFFVGSDDNVEGELRGEALLRAIQERTPLGISPPGIAQPKQPGGKARVIVRKANR